MTIESIYKEWLQVRQEISDTDIEDDAILDLHSRATTCVAALSAAPIKSKSEALMVLNAGLSVVDQLPEPGNAALQRVRGYLADDTSD